MDHWAGTVFIAALTSGLVALGIEWLAKPRLEARKERLLHLHRARQTFQANVVRLLADWARVSAAAALPLPRDLKSEVRRAARGEVNRAVQRIDYVTKEMADKLEDYALTYGTASVRDLVLEYVAVARGVQLSDRTQVEKAEILKEISAPLHTVLFGRWRFVSRWRALTDLPKAMAKYDPDFTSAGESVSAVKLEETSSDQGLTAG
jgi:hypothetical protein